MTANIEPTTHFGHQRVPLQEKQSKVSAVFDRVVDQYDLMNDVMSFGLHHVWKQLTVLFARVKPGHIVLDLAAGTGDMTAQLCRAANQQAAIIACDINAAMLQSGRDKLLDAGLCKGLHYTQANAEQLPFRARCIQIITMSFGLRNVPRIAAALREMRRVIKPGGQCLILEFSEVNYPIIKQLYDAYSYAIIPRLGAWLADDAESYQYLVESIREHPNQARLAGMMSDAGFDDVRVQNFLGGVVALHRGFVY